MASPPSIVSPGAPPLSLLAPLPQSSISSPTATERVVSTHAPPADMELANGTAATGHAAVAPLR